MTTPRHAPPHVFLDFVGCRLNQAEIERLARNFLAAGYRLTADPAEADLMVLNTCAVTREAARKSRQAIRQAGRANPSASIVATGCYATLSPERLSALPQVTQVIDNQDKDRLVTLLTGEPPLYEQEPLLREPARPGMLGRTRAFVKIQDGCDNRCSFCVTTIARGPGRSRSGDEIITEVNRLTDAGYNEVVLTGVHLGSYGHDRGEQHGLRRLVEALLADTSISRLRLSSLEPWDIDPGFFDLWEDARLCPHLHLPLQSGCQTTLRRMARRTTPAAFGSLVDAARARIPDLAITTDVIVGFPGETDDEFEQSYRFIEEMRFARLHVFTYSSRAGTAAAAMTGQIPAEVKRARHTQLRALGKAHEHAFRRQYLGCTLTVLWESAHGATAEGFNWSGLTGNYLRITTKSHNHLHNTITPVLTTALTDDGLLADVLSAA